MFYTGDKPTSYIITPRTFRLEIRSFYRLFSMGGRNQTWLEKPEHWQETGNLIHKGKVQFVFDSRLVALGCLVSLTTSICLKLAQLASRKDFVSSRLSVFLWLLLPDGFPNCLIKSPHFCRISHKLVCLQQTTRCKV